MSHSPDWDEVSRDDVMRAIQEYDRLGPDRFFAQHGFAPTTTYELVFDDRSYPPKALLGTAYEFATGRRLASAISRAGRRVPSAYSESWGSPSSRSVDRLSEAARPTTRSGRDRQAGAGASGRPRSRSAARAGGQDAVELTARGDAEFGEDFA
jgi:hypothetical protein